MQLQKKATDKHLDVDTIQTKACSTGEYQCKVSLYSCAFFDYEAEEKEVDEVDHLYCF